MADYWKSQPRKQCEFCKCWIADNKPSIDFHENGKKHKENVAKRLSEITKKSAKEAKQQIQVDKEIKKMEEAALRAYMKDIGENADYTSKLLLEGLDQKQKAADDLAAKQADAKMAREAAKQREKIEQDLKRKRVKEKAKTTKWYEARSDEGFSYYWHTETNETKWDVPQDGYITVSEQKTLEEPEPSRPVKSEFKKKDKSKAAPGSYKRKSHDDPPNNPVKKKPGDTKLPGTRDGTSKKAADSFKKRAEVSKNNTGPSKVSDVMGPAPKPVAYGLWKAVETKVEEDPVDLQLPSQEWVAHKVPTLVDDRPKIQFHEKKISRPLVDDASSSSQASFSGFKKKGFRGNVRQRLDTDD